MSDILCILCLCELATDGKPYIEAELVDRVTRERELVTFCGPCYALAQMVYLVHKGEHLPVITQREHRGKA